MGDQPSLQILFMILAAGSLVLPMRWALLSFILISHVDMTSSSFDSATSIGLENAIKTLVLPTVLFLRFSRRRILGFRHNVVLVIWGSLTLYAASACLWTPFQLSGVKMVGYMYCYIVLSAVFLDGWLSGKLTPGLLAAALWISLLMGVVQTYLLGNDYGKSIPGLRDDRFTSFCSPQLFGAFLLAVLSILFVTSRQRPLMVCLHGLGGFCGIVLCGSRYVFLGSLILLVIVWGSHIVRQSSSDARAIRVVAGMGGVLVLTSIFGAFVYLEPDNRISQLVTMLAEGQSPIDNIGTLVWRRGIYDQAWNSLTHRGPVELAFGSGTSSGASVVLGWDRRYLENRIDANRVVHNELLRVLFEWGILGLILFVAFLASILRLFLHHAFTRRIIPAYAFVALFPTVMLGCLSENILAASASPAGVGFLLSMMYGVSYLGPAARKSASLVAPDVVTEPHAA